MSRAESSDNEQELRAAGRGNLVFLKRVGVTVQTRSGGSAGCGKARVRPSHPIYSFTPYSLRLIAPRGAETTFYVLSRS